MMRRLTALAFALGVSSFALPSAARGKGCVEVSDIVGEQKCSTYGDRWSIERTLPLTLRFGFRWADATVADRSFHEAFRSRSRPKGYEGYDFHGSALGPKMLTAAGGDGGVTVFVVGQLYLGAEGSFMLGSADTNTILTTSRTRGKINRYSLENETGLDVSFLHLGVPIGYRVPLGRVSLRGEMMFGGNVVSVSHHARDLETGKRLDRASSAVIPMIEPRFAADLWLTQHVSFGAYAGTNLLDTKSRSFGLTFTFHMRSFDGDMALW